MDTIESATKMTTKTIVAMKSHFSMPRLVRKTESDLSEDTPQATTFDLKKYRRYQSNGNHYLYDKQTSFHLFFP